MVDHADYSAFTTYSMTITYGQIHHLLARYGYQTTQSHTSVVLYHCHLLSWKDFSSTEYLGTISLRSADWRLGRFVRQQQASQEIIIRFRKVFNCSVLLGECDFHFWAYIHTMDDAVEDAVEIFKGGAQSWLLSNFRVGWKSPFSSSINSS